MRNTFIIIVIAAIIAVYIVYKKSKMEFKYFSYSEFDSPDAPGSGKEHMSKAFIQILDKIREETGIPMFVSSGYRTKEHNAAVGGVANSAHTRGTAADIRTPAGVGQETIAKAAAKLGIKRIGFGTNFIHLDVDPNLPQNVTWAYNGKKPPYTIAQLKTLA